MHSMGWSKHFFYSTAKDLVWQKDRLCQVLYRVWLSTPPQLIMEYLTQCLSVISVWETKDLSITQEYHSVIHAPSAGSTGRSAESRRKHCYGRALPRACFSCASPPPSLGTTPCVSARARHGSSTIASCTALTPASSPSTRTTTSTRCRSLYR